MATNQPQTNPAASSEVRAVFDHWREIHGHPSARLTTKRIKRVKARLAEGYDVATLKRAVDGCKLSPYHMGQNDTGTVYDDLELICRDGERVEKFAGYAISGTAMAADVDSRSNAKRGTDAAFDRLERLSGDDGFFSAVDSWDDSIPCHDVPTAVGRADDPRMGGRTFGHQPARLVADRGP